MCKVALKLPNYGKESGPLVSQGEKVGFCRIFNQRGRIFVPYYFEQGKILVPLEEYILLYPCIGSITLFVCKIFASIKNV